MVLDFSHSKVLPIPVGHFNPLTHCKFYPMGHLPWIEYGKELIKILSELEIDFFSSWISRFSRKFRVNDLDLYQRYTCFLKSQNTQTWQNFKWCRCTDVPMLPLYYQYLALFIIKTKVIFQLFDFLVWKASLIAHGFGEYYWGNDQNCNLHEIHLVFLDWASEFLTIFKIKPQEFLFLCYFSLKLSYFLYLLMVFPILNTCFYTL